MRPAPESHDAHDRAAFGNAASRRPQKRPARSQLDLGISALGTIGGYQGAMRSGKGKSRSRLLLIRSGGPFGSLRCARRLPPWRLPVGGGMTQPDCRRRSRACSGLAPCCGWCIRRAHAVRATRTLPDWRECTEQPSDRPRGLPGASSSSELRWWCRPVRSLTANIRST